MIILDTKVLSELMKPAPTASVVEWMAAQPAASLFFQGATSSPRGPLEAVATGLDGWRAVDSRPEGKLGISLVVVTLHEQGP